MKSVLLINGHEPYAFAEGRFNQTMLDEIESGLQGWVNISKTIIKDGYNAEEEQEKFKKADVIVFQFPIYWFNVPALMKKYIDEVYAHGVFFGMGKKGGKYGYGNGLMNGKKYMFSITSNAPEDAFDNREAFFEGQSLDQFLFPLHKTHEFCGMSAVKSFGAFNVIKKPQVENDKKRLTAHINEVLLPVLN